tara:strand:- start:159 stop:530 length:372 start_codon:yes stop_codon:yes gene_type:complete
MKVSNNKLRQIIKEALMLEEPKIDLKPSKNPDKSKVDKDLDIDAIGLSVPANLKKLLDPDISPAKYADLDQVIDQADNVNHQALAIAGFALSYADMDESSANKILVKAKELVSKIIKSQQNNK